MINYLNSGDLFTLDLESGESVTSGDLVFLDGGVFGVAQKDGDGDTDANAVACKRSGKYSLAITAGNTAVSGDPAYYDGGLPGVTTEAIGPMVGFFAEDLGAGDTEIEVVLVPTPGGMVFGEGIAELDASSGLAIGDTEFGGELPIGAVIVESHIHVETTFTSATDAATIALGLTTDAEGEIDTAIAISHGTSPWDAGTRAGDPYTTPLTDRRRFVANVAVEALTAGRLQLAYKYAVFS